jgi:cysteine desulfurase/selenocysteine lyase
MNITSHIRSEFPLLVRHPDLVYLDSTATSLKPASVIRKVNEYYNDYSANIFRGVYDISERATAEYEESRQIIAQFINADVTEEIIFTRGTTEAINLFAHGIRDIVSEGDEILTSIFEHHSNFVPWQQLAKDKKATFVVARSIEEVIQSVTRKTKILAITHTSNVFGTVHPIQEIVKKAKKINPDILVIVDGAQAVPHMKIDVQKLGCDAFAFSGHKMLGPTGVGVLWARKRILEHMKPYQFGGDMIRSVAITHTTFADVPHRFEAGTPAIAEVIALKEAVRFLEAIGLDTIHKHELSLAQLCHDELKKAFGNTIRIVGPIQRESGVVAFSFANIHAHDIAQVLNEDGIAVRAGHHCAMPLHTFLDIEASVRASFYVYNTTQDIEKLVASLTRIVRLFA